MSWVITAVVASTAASVYTSSVSAKAQQAQIQDQMKQEELAAKSEELARREELNAALAANAIDVSQSGVDAATFASLSLNSARQAGLAEGQEELSQRLRQAALQRKSRNVGAIRDAQIASTLLQAPIKYMLNGHKSWRSRVWRDLDADRTGMLPFVFEEGMGFQRYVDYALDVPMYFVYRDGKYINALGQSFRDFLQGKLPALPGEVPTLSDWADHLTTIFPEARIKQFMEMRGADGGPWRRLCALPAFWVGVLYDQTALDAAWDLVKGMDAQTRDEMRIAASVDGLQAEAGGIKMMDLARQAVAISQAGLTARRRSGAGGLVPDETHFLNALQDSLETGQTPADELLACYHGDWQGDLTRIYEEYSY